MHDDMRILPLTPTLGAEISGIDIMRMDRSRFESLHRVWLEYKVLFLRDQDIDLEPYSHSVGTSASLCAYPTSSRMTNTPTSSAC